MKNGKTGKIYLILTDFAIHHEVVSAEFRDMAGIIHGHFSKDIFNENLEWLYTDLNEVTKVRYYKNDEMGDIPLRTHMIFVLKKVLFYFKSSHLFFHPMKRRII